MRRPAKPDPPPRKARNLNGMRFGRLKVMHYAGNDKHRKALWCCVCDCGNAVMVPGFRLLGQHHGGPTKSCGCLRADPDFRRQARLKVTAKRRKEICKTMRESVRRKSMPWKLSAAIAADLLGVRLDEIRAMVQAGDLTGQIRTGQLFVSSQQIAQLIAARERRRRVCKKFDADMMAQAAKRH